MTEYLSLLIRTLLEQATAYLFSLSDPIRVCDWFYRNRINYERLLAMSKIWQGLSLPWKLHPKRSWPGMVGKLNGDVKQSESSFNSYVNVVSLVKIRQQIHDHSISQGKIFTSLYCKNAVPARNAYRLS